MEKWIKDIVAFKPQTEQEEVDQKLIVDFIKKNDNSLTRDNKVAHVSSSGFILNKRMDKALMVYHKIYRSWSWTGGHADGESDLLKVAIEEAKEETGIEKVKPLTEKIVTLDVLPVPSHFKHGKFVSAHLHLSIAYVLIADDTDRLIVKEDENSGVKWMKIKDIDKEVNELDMKLVYNKLINRAKKIRIGKE
jgi:8-oxo-dGTP pyrophosphatase MutT (NUDIX family)